MLVKTIAKICKHSAAFFAEKLSLYVLEIHFVCKRTDGIRFPRAGVAEDQHLPGPAAPRFLFLILLKMFG